MGEGCGSDLGQCNGVPLSVMEVERRRECGECVTKYGTLSGIC
jgi:hypothetical protein